MEFNFEFVCTKQKIRYLDAALVGLSPDMRMVLKMNHILNSNKKEMRTMRRQTAGSSLTLGCITSVGIFFNQDVICCGAGGSYAK